MIKIIKKIRLNIHVLRGDNTVNSENWKLICRHCSSKPLYGAGESTLKHEFFERPGKNLWNSYNFDYEKCAGIMSSGVCTWPDFRFLSSLQLLIAPLTRKENSPPEIKWHRS